MHEALECTLSYQESLCLAISIAYSMQYTPCVVVLQEELPFWGTHDTCCICLHACVYKSIHNVHAAIKHGKDLKENTVRDWVKAEIGNLAVAELSCIILIS